MSQTSSAKDQMQDYLLSSLDESRREDLFRALLESSQDSIKILDLEGSLLSMNRSGQHLLELERDREWFHRNWLEFWPAAHRGSVEAALEKARNGESGRFEAYRNTAKGRPTWWDVTVSPIHDDAGVPRNILAIARDVTERRRASDAVRHVMEASFVVTESLDYEETLSNVARVLVPDLADWCAIDVATEDGSLEQAAVVHSDPEKVELVRQMRRRYPTDPNASYGSPYVLRTGKTDIGQVTDEVLEQAAHDEEHLRLMRELNLHFYAAVPMKARGRVLGTFVIVSAESERTYTEEDLPLLEELGRICGLAVDNARLYRAVNAELRERRKVERELRTLNETLEQRVAQRTAALREANDNLVEEIRERKRAEAELAESNRQLRARNRELQEFADAASHDLKEPLRKISSFADLIATEFEDQLPDQVYRYLDRIQHASIRTSDLIRDLLAYSRVAVDPNEKAVVDLNTVVREVLIDLEVPISETDAQVDVADLPLVHGDKTQLRQLFQNLISNALKFQRNGTRPHVEISATRVDDTGSGAKWSIAVADNGIGFDDRYAERIFSPFQRLHEKGTYPGTGMGLAICRRIVERHRGEITAESREGHGTTFRFTLSAADG